LQPLEVPSGSWLLLCCVVMEFVFVVLLISC
jgi:hypothetical protein